MAEARILITGPIIRTTGLSEFSYCKYGTVQGFTFNNVKYQFCNTKIKGDFYSLADYQAYLNELVREISPERSVPIQPFSNFEYVEAGDEIYLYRREITDLQAGAPVKVWWQGYKFNYNGLTIYKEYQSIPLPPNFQNVGAPNFDHTIAGNAFFNNYIIKAFPTLDYSLADVLADIQQSIDSIEDNIFSTAELSSIDAVQIKSQQRLLWSDGMTYNFGSRREYILMKNSLAYFSIFFQSFRLIINDDIVLMYVYFASVMQSKALESLSPDIKFRMLHRLAAGDLDYFQLFRYKPEDDESVVATIIASVTAPESTLFLNELINPNSKYTPQSGFSLFKLFANGIQDLTVGRKEKKDFYEALYTVWKKSEYNPYRSNIFDQVLLDSVGYNLQLGTTGSWGFGATNSIVYNYNAKPFVINYQSIKIAGIFWDDYKFYFTEEFIKHHWEPENAKFAPLDRIFIWKTKAEADDTQPEGLRGVYHYFDPVSLVDSDPQALMKIPVLNGNDDSAMVANHPENINNLVPVFLLKYIDDVSDEHDFNTMVGYFIDVISIFAGGASVLTKLKYLRSLSGFNVIPTTATYIGIGASGLQFAAGGLRFLTNFVDNCDTDPRWIKIRTLLMWMEIGAGSLDVIATRNIKIKAKQTVDDFNTTGWPTEFNSGVDGIAAKDELLRIAGLGAQIATQVLDEFITKVKAHIARLYDREPSTFKNIKAGTTQILQTESFITDLSTIGYNIGITETEMAELFHIARKNTKQIEPAQLILQTKYFGNGIKVQGFPACFASMAKFKDFANSVKNTLDNCYTTFDNIYGLNLKSLKYDLKIQGSAVRKKFPTDPWPNGLDPADYVGLNSPGDLEFAVLMNESDFISLVEELKELTKKHILDAKAARSMMSSLDNGLKSGNLKKDVFQQLYLPNHSRDILFELRQVARPHTAGKGLNFAIIMKGTRLDLGPYINFKF